MLHISEIVDVVFLRATRTKMLDSPLTLSILDRLVRCWDPLEINNVPEATHRYRRYARHLAEVIKQGGREDDFRKAIRDFEREMGVIHMPARAKDLCQRITRLANAHQDHAARLADQARPAAAAE